MNKNLLFLTLGLAVAATEVSPANTKRKRSHDDAQEQADDDAALNQVIRQQDQDRASRPNIQTAAQLPDLKPSPMAVRLPLLPIAEKPDPEFLQFTRFYILGEEFMRLDVLGEKLIISREDLSHRLHWAVESGKIDLVKALIAVPGINVNATDRDGWTALHHAARLRRIEILEALLKVQGIDVHAKTEWGATALEIGIGWGHTATLQPLINCGANVNETNRWGEPVLHHPATTGNKDVVEALIYHKANIDAKDRSGWTALHLASLHGRKEIVEILLLNNADTTSLTDCRKTAADLAKTQEIRQLILDCAETAADVARTEEIRQLILAPQQPQ